MKRTVGSLKSALLPALQPFSAVLDPPSSENDIQLHEDKVAVEGAEESQGELRSLEGDAKKSLVVLGWPRWKKVYVG